ncbi:acyl carrier protein [Vulgatibacter incomptus]|uniref:Acyl carrier protein n=1 Tax=Vulgatibacter incomptus TaxID=1391653 RepID=A0A0K1P9R5_9BACT|nr:acyl carrier protein [Vulgatibacter incomptus]AKU89854.1 Acyl carrier protein [Vulgatibacter incomptus]
MNVSSNIRSFISETFFVDDFADEDSFLQTGIIDSTGMMELVAFLEQSFEIKITDAELIPDNLDSLANLCRFVERKRSEAA